MDQANLRRLFLLLFLVPVLAFGQATVRQNNATGAVIDPVEAKMPAFRASIGLGTGSAVTFDSLTLGPTGLLTVPFAMAVDDGTLGLIGELQGLGTGIPAPAFGLTTGDGSVYLDITNSTFSEGWTIPLSNVRAGPGEIILSHSGGSEVYTPDGDTDEDRGAALTEALNKLNQLGYADGAAGWCLLGELIEVDDVFYGVATFGGLSRDSLEEDQTLALNTDQSANGGISVAGWTHGVIFKITPAALVAGTAPTVMYRFLSTDPWQPRAGLTEGPTDGGGVTTFYFTCSLGEIFSAYPFGAICSITSASTPEAETFTMLKAFQTGLAHGAFPSGKVLYINEGGTHTLYGTCQAGGGGQGSDNDSGGCIWRYIPATSDFDFFPLTDIDTGQEPVAGLTERPVSDDLLYGVCQKWGVMLTGCTAAGGVITKAGHGMTVGDRFYLKSGTGVSGITANQSYFVHSVDGDDFEFQDQYAYHPNAVPDTDASFTDGVIVTGNGTLFSIEKDMTNYTVLHYFRGSDGKYPAGKVAFNSTEARMLGTCAKGGANGYGTIWRYTFAGTVMETVHDFDRTEGSYPVSGLALSPTNPTHSGSVFYGTTSEGGTANSGVFYQWDDVEAGTPFHVFASILNGMQGRSTPLTYAGDWYFTTSAGGLYDAGTIQKYDDETVIDQASLTTEYECPGGDARASVEIGPGVYSLPPFTLTAGRVKFMGRKAVWKLEDEQFETNRIFPGGEWEVGGFAGYVWQLAAWKNRFNLMRGVEVNGIEFDTNVANQNGGFCNVGGLYLIGADMVVDSCHFRNWGGTMHLQGYVCWIKCDGSFTDDLYVNYAAQPMSSGNIIRNSIIELPFYGSEGLWSGFRIGGDVPTDFIADSTGWGGDSLITNCTVRNTDGFIDGVFGAYKLQGTTRAKLVNSTANQLGASGYAYWSDTWPIIDLLINGLSASDVGAGIVFGYSGRTAETARNVTITNCSIKSVQGALDIDAYMPGLKVFNNSLEGTHATTGFAITAAAYDSEDARIGPNKLVSGGALDKIDGLDTFTTPQVVDSVAGATVLGMPGAAGVLALNGSTSGTISIKGAAASGTWTFELPQNDGDSGQFLRTNGSGVTTWVTASGTGDALVADPLSQFAATTSAQLRGVLTDESGTGVFLTVNGDGGSVTLDASGFDGNLATTDNTLQEVAQKLDDLSASFGESSLAGLVNNQILWDGANASRTLTLNVSGTDSVITVSSGVVNVSTGALQVGGSAVLTAATGQPLDATLTALAAYNTNGILTQTAADTFTGRTMTEGLAIDITNGDGVSGNPTFAFDPTEVSGNRTWAAGGAATIIWTFDLAGMAVDPTITFGDGIIEFANVLVDTLSATTVSATTLAGNGQDVTNISADNIGTGTIDAARLEHSLTFVISGAGSPITTGVKDIIVNSKYAGAITDWSMTVSPADTITVDILRSVDGGAAPSSSIIGAGTKPSIASGVNDHDAESDWSSDDIAAYDNFKIQVTAVGGTATSATLTIYYR